MNSKDKSVIKILLAPTTMHTRSAMSFYKIRRKVTNCIFRMRFRTFFFLVGTSFLLYFCILVILQIRKEMSNDSSEYEIPLKWTGNLADVHDPIILWWTPLTGTQGEVRQCGEHKCFFTQDRRFMNHRLMKMFLFYGTRFNPFDLPLPRNGSSVYWALLHEESPKNTPILLHPETLALFNYSSTFSRQSDFPLTLQYLKDVNVLTDLKFYVPTHKKDKLLKILAPVAYIHSDCATPLDRDAYATELMKYIPVDSYGKCAQNKKLPPHLADPLKSMDANEFLHYIARYKFTLTFENAICEDYVTEKLWRPLIVGSVPIYLGSPSVKDWLPNNNSAILADDFDSPKDLANYLIKLNKDRRQYESHLQHKLAVSPNSKVTNENLISALRAREWGIDNDYEKGNFIEHYECFLCKTLHERSPKDINNIVDSQHYDCDTPVSPLTHEPDPSNWWNNQWKSSKCEAKVLRSFTDNGKNINTHDEFLYVLKKYIMNDEC